MTSSIRSVGELEGGRMGRKKGREIEGKVNGQEGKRESKYRRKGEWR